MDSSSPTQETSKQLGAKHISVDANKVGYFGSHGATEDKSTLQTGKEVSNYQKIIFRPIELKLAGGQGDLGNISPYCKIKLGWHTAKGAIANKEGQNPKWDDSIKLERKHNEQYAKLKVKDKNSTVPNDNIGSVKIDIADISNKANISGWYDLKKGSEVVGQIFISMESSN